MKNCASGLEYELSVIEKTGFVQLLSHRLGLHQLRETARHSGGAGPRIGGGIADCVCAGDHRYRPAAVMDLIFERFLNPERISPPDIDVDFAWSAVAR